MVVFLDIYTEGCASLEPPALQISVPVSQKVAEKIGTQCQKEV